VRRRARGAADFARGGGAAAAAAAARARAHPRPRRIAALESGEVDLVIYGFSVTAERAESVRFVRPFYAFEGGDLYQSPAAPLSPAPAAWADLAGESICVEAGSYLVGPLQDLGVAPFEVDSALDYGTAIANGSCVAGASDDYSALEEGLERVAAVGALEPRPYAVAVAKNATSDELALRVSGALVALLTGPDAPLVASERLGFAQIGVDPGPAVAQLSRALTTMDACPAEAAEGAAPPPASAARCRGLAAVAAAAAAAAALL
jgi:ABC-type amino acid transport substrate-binding protein